ncbi:uncharacterized protein FIBRA_08360 [Fibroporia radiculosa]|uniref:Nephrocystin 3-like N-terminal domain-containing protein n=1 Tax=Fibroporia radiculosa TaxID=599839 RepID=J4ICB3_9APHY|nr:uncharacterized protein FIBRA_08360 [Fibroporia radiculosa]CCM06111.1 predicted protein [Fibroporia radiculosa]
MAKDLARHNPLVRRALARALHEDDELKHTRDLTQQWAKLIVEPIREAWKSIRTPVLVVIDALDESGAEDTRKLLLQLVSGKQTGALIPLPPNFRILITSRPLPDIYNAFHRQQFVQHVSLDDIASEFTLRDVDQFIAARLGDLRIFQAQHYAALAQKSGGIFEWARLSCEYITKQSSMGLTSSSRYDAVIAGTST